MPAFEQHLTFIVRSIRAFLNLEAGVTRGEIEPLPMRADLVRQLEEARRELESRDRMPAELRARPVTTGTETRSRSTSLTSTSACARSRRTSATRGR